MIMKHIGLAATLAATFITASAAIAHAESNVGGLDGGLTTEHGLERGWRGYDGSYAYAPAVAPGAYAYGYARDAHASRHTGMRHHRR